MRTEVMPKRKKWEWVEFHSWWDLRVGILNFQVQEHAGLWFIGRCGVFEGKGHKTVDDAFEEAEEKAFLIAMRIVQELPDRS